MTKILRGMGIAVLGTAVGLSTVRAEVGYPQGIQDFEALTVGQDLATALPSWVIVNTSAPLSNHTIVVSNEVMGDCRRRCDSTQWLRSTDIDGGNVQNRFYSPPIVKQGENLYRWTFYVNLENTPPGGASTKPKFTIQHRDGASVFQNAWGIEFTDTGANLRVLGVAPGIGGVDASMPLYPISGATGVGAWVKLDLVVDFGGNTVSGSANNGTPVSLPINLNGNEDQFRFCYRGEGTGNIQTLLLDDVSVCVGPSCPASPACTTPRQCPTVSAAGMVAIAGLMMVAGGAAMSRRNRFALGRIA